MNKESGIVKVEIVRKTIQQREGKSPPIKLCITRYLPPTRLSNNDYGITQEQFHNILDKASRPIRCEPKSDLEQP